MWAVWLRVGLEVLGHAGQVHPDATGLAALPLEQTGLSTAPGSDPSLSSRPYPPEPALLVWTTTVRCQPQRWGVALWGWGVRGAHFSEDELAARLLPQSCLLNWAEFLEVEFLAQSSDDLRG